MNHITQPIAMAHAATMQTATAIATAGSLGGGFASGMAIYVNNYAGFFGVLISALSLVAAVGFGLWNVRINHKAKKIDREKLKHEIMKEMIETESEN